ncbi:retrovirus-related Pol polyprotein from transposon TNT 1-94 [Trichonephila clavipes]|nr:retrovirus-related Pol polyprotein from transposon TNT 1-94 [Trichonephila clavipes]
MLRSSVIQLISGRMLLFQSKLLSSQSLDSIKFNKSSKISISPKISTWLNLKDLVIVLARYATTKAIYGLKQAPRCWNKRFKSFAENSGLKQSNCDPCLFFNDEKSMYLIVYVDDGIIAADEEQTVNLFLKKLESEFSVVIEAYCRKILSRFDMINSNHVSTPIEKGAISTDDSVSLSADVPYREAVGNLMFLAIVTRPDIAYAVGVLSQVLDKPQQIHWTMVKRILRYLNGTQKYGIMYLSVSSATLESYSDSDYAGDPLTRRSTSGMVFKYNGGAIA